MAVSLAPFIKFRGFDNNGNPLNGGLLFTYAAGTTTKQATYTDSTGVTQNANPIVLNSRGECDVWLTSNLLYKFVLAPSTDTDPPTNAFWTEDNISGIAGSTSIVNNAVLNASQSWTQPQTFSAGIILASSTFASLPGAANVPVGTQYFVSDVGVNGSTWQSNGTVWTPVNGVTNLFETGIPFILVPSGNIAVTTGINTLGTALDQTYANCYAYFPAGAWTGSTAGWYYCTMSSTTSMTVYSNAYTSGVPTIPASPTLVTTGAGAYTQTTGSYLTGPAFTVQGNLLGKNGRLRATFGMTANNSAGNKLVKAVYGTAISGAGALLTTGIYLQNIVTVSNLGVTGKQAYIQSQTGQGNGVTSVDSTANQTFSLAANLATATDWVVIQYSDVQLIE